MVLIVIAMLVTGIALLLGKRRPSGISLTQRAHKKAKETTTTSSDPEPKKGKLFGVWVWIKNTLRDGKFRTENWFSVTFFVLTLHLLVIAIDKHWWWENIFLQRWMWLITGLAIGWGTIAPEGAKKIHGKLAKFSIVLIILTFFIALGKQNIVAGWDKAKQKYSRPPNATVLSANSAGGPNSHVQQVVYDILEHELPSTDAFKMTQIASCESGFRHFEDDGVTPLRGRKKDTGEIVPTVKGVFQIKEDAWPELKKLGYNIDRLEDNIHAAIWIHKQGLDNRWDCNEQVEEELGEARRDLITIIAPVGEWSEPLDVSTRYCSGGLGKHLWAMDDRGNEYEIDPTKPTVAIPTLSFRFKAYGNEPETLEFTCVKK